MIFKRDIEFEIGDIVYLVTDGETGRMVTGYIFTANDVLYQLSYGTGTSEHYGIEISADKIYS